LSSSKTKICILEFSSVKSLNSLIENLDDISGASEEDSIVSVESIDEMSCDDEKEAVESSDSALGVETVCAHAVMNNRRIIRIDKITDSFDFI